jgi:putative ABC transport system substrate-binding protein
MKRREFIAGLGGTAAWPLVAWAQQPVIGFLHPRSLADAVPLIAAFRRGLQEANFIEGTNLAVEYRFAEGQPERLAALAAGLVDRRVAVIVAGARAGEAAKAATATIPIVFLSGGDPVRTGLVASLNRPGGNVTGVSLLSLDLEAKRVDILHDLNPHLTSIAILADSTSASMDYQAQEARAAARKLDVSVRLYSVRSDQDFDAAFMSIARERAGALIVTGSVYFLFFRDRLVTLAAQHKIPAIYELREFTEVGGLISYGPNVIDAWRQVGNYTGRILKGEKPPDLPVVQPTKYDLIINLQAAKALDLIVPPQLLARADEVIE